MIADPNDNDKRPLARVLKAARARIQVRDSELAEARRRRGLLAAALRREFPGCRIYLNGSVAHGDALTPLTDVDVGVVVPDPDGEYGPSGNGPAKLKDRAANAIRDALKEQYPNLRVIVGDRPRSVYVSFGAPVDPNSKDFSADVIVAVDNPTGKGLYIPHYDGWDRSDPEEHTRLVRAAVESSTVEYSRTVRLLKHWARTHSKPLCSWNIKALGLDCLADPHTQLDGMLAWFDHAIADLSVRETPDPAGVAGPIKLPGDRRELVDKLTKARAKLKEALDFDAAGYDVLAVDALATFFNDPDMLAHPNPREVHAQHSKRIADLRVARTTPAVLTGLRHRDRTPVRSWAP